LMLVVYSGSRDTWGEPHGTSGHPVSDHSALDCMEALRRSGRRPPFPGAHLLVLRCDDRGPYLSLALVQSTAGRAALRGLPMRADRRRMGGTPRRSSRSNGGPRAIPRQQSMGSLFVRDALGWARIPIRNRVAAASQPVHSLAAASMVLSATRKRGRQ
jgi:hypothetical protein